MKSKILLAWAGLLIAVFESGCNSQGSLVKNAPVAPIKVTPLPNLEVSKTQLGVFVSWPQNGSREQNVHDWESGLNLPGSSVLAMDYYGQNTWADLTNWDWLPRYWSSKNPNRNLIWSIQLTISGTPLSDVAAGKHDSDFQVAAQHIAANQPHAIIRIGWEMNGNWYPWASGGKEADYIAAFRRVVGIFRKESTSFKFDWCPNIGLQNSKSDLAYPGDDVVDFIGEDVYDYDLSGTKDPVTNWNLSSSSAYGLQWHKSFAALHGKPMSYPEWGVGQYGDNSYFVQQMHDWFVNNNVAYEAYFDINGTFPTQLDGGSLPKSEALYHTLFGR